MAEQVRDPRCDQDQESMAQKDKRVRHEHADLERLKRELGATRYRRLLEGSDG